MFGCLQENVDIVILCQTQPLPKFKTLVSVFCSSKWVGINDTIFFLINIALGLDALSYTSVCYEKKK